MLGSRINQNPRFAVFISAVILGIVTWQAQRQYSTHQEWKRIEAAGAYREVALPIRSANSMRSGKSSMTCNVEFLSEDQLRLIKLSYGGPCTHKVGEDMKLYIPNDESKHPVLKDHPPQPPQLIFVMLAVILAMFLYSLNQLYRKNPT